MDLNEPIPIQYDIDCCQDRIAILEMEIGNHISDLYQAQRELEQERDRLDDLLSERGD